MLHLIGDIHGHADKLKELLTKLGHSKTQHYYTHPTRKVLFVGGYIDRVPKIKETLATITQMVTNGSAIALMGNHEAMFLEYLQDPHSAKAGVFICLELLERFDNIAVALFAAEEAGCVGSRNADPKFFERVGCVIEFDCPGRGLVSYTSGGVRLFENGGDFITESHHRELSVLLVKMADRPFLAQKAERLAGSQGEWGRENLTLLSNVTRSVPKTFQSGWWYC